MNLDYLYRQIIMDHYKNPRNLGLKEDDKYQKTRLYNPSCGDDITVQVYVLDKTIKDIRQIGFGCSICLSSASVMSEILIDKTVAEAKKITNAFYNLLMNKPYEKNLLSPEVLAYQGVSNFPARIKCATLAWKAFEQIINEMELK